MNVPFVDLPRQIKPYEEEIREVFEQVVFQRADFIMRQDLLDFEEAFSSFVGTRFTVGVANGSDALNLALRVLEIGPGDEVITVSHTFVATIAAIVHAGATPVLVDVGADHNMDPEAVAKAISPRTRAIIPVHLNGRVCRMDFLCEIAEEKDLYVIEDSAQAIGARYDNRMAGSFGILSTNSFYPFKVMGCFGDGGAITTSDQELDRKLRCLRDNGQDREQGEILEWGWNSRLDNLQAAVLLVVMRHLPDILERRRALAEVYEQELRDIEGKIALPTPPRDSGKHFDVFQNYVICTKDRDALRAFLAEKGVGTLISWPKPTHKHIRLGLEEYSLPRTEELSAKVLSLPMHPALEESEVKYVCGKIKEHYGA